MAADISSQTRLPQIQNPAKENPRRDRKRMWRQNLLIKREHRSGGKTWRNPIPYAEEERIKQNQRTPSMDRDDKIQRRAP